MSQTSQEVSPTELLKQVELEKLFNKNQTLSRIRREFTECDDFDFPKYIDHMAIPVDFGLDLLVQIALHKRADLSTMVGLLRHHFKDASSPAQSCADMLLKAAMADLVTWNAAYQQFIVIYTISQDVQDELDRFQFPLPMVIPPRTVRKNTDNGYVLGAGSLLLRDNHHNDDICLDHINRVNQIPLAIDHDTATMIKNRWRNLDKAKEGESREDFEKRKRAFEKYDRTTKDVIAELGDHSGRFYLTHKYDKRGRTYCQGYHVNYQGAPWNKAVICLADKEHVE